MDEYTKVPAWLMRRTDLSHGCKLVWARLNRYAGNNGQAFPKVETLAHEVGIKSTQCRVYIHELMNSGLLKVEYIPGSRSQYLPLRDAEGQRDAETPPSGCRVRGLRDAEGASERRTKKRTEYTKSFLRFWSAYPRKSGKKAAFAAWRRATDKPPVEKLIEVISRHRESAQWKKDNGQFIPLPATWLNQGRWDDELEPDQPQPLRVVV